MASFSNSILSPRQESVLRLDFADATVEMTRNIYTYGNQDWSYSTWEGSPHADAVKEWGSLPPDVPASHVTQVGSFLDSRDRNERPEVSGADIRGTIEFLTAFYKSAVEGRPVHRGEIRPGDPWYRLMNGQFQLLDEAAA